MENEVDVNETDTDQQEYGDMVAKELELVVKTVRENRSQSEAG